MALDIKVGQQWETRNGTILRVTGDRGDGERWRWALSNSEIADEHGRISFDPSKEDRHDLMRLIPPGPKNTNIMQQHIDAVDSTIGGLN